MRRTLLWFIAVLGLLLVVCGLGSVALMRMRGAKPPAPGAEYATVERQSISDEVIETGNIQPLRTVQVRSLASGRLAKILVRVNEFVKKGQVVALIDPRQAKFQLDQALAQYQGAQSAVRRDTLQIAQRRVSSQAAYDQALVRLETAQLNLQTQPAVTRAQIEQARSGLDSAISQRQQLRSSGLPNEEVDAKSALDQAVANKQNAQREYARQVQLSAKGYVAGKSKEDAQLALELANAQLTSAKNTYATLQAKQNAELVQANQQVVQAQAALKQALANAVVEKTTRQAYLSAAQDVATAKAALMDPAIMTQSRAQDEASAAQSAANLKDAEKQYSETSVRAPSAGVITQKLLQEGELVTGLSSFTEGTAIMQEEDRSQMRVDLQINEIDVAKLRTGMLSTVDVAAVPSKEYQGVVQKISPSSIQSIAAASSTQTAPTASTTNNVVQYDVLVRIIDPDSRLKTGMSAKCTIITTNARNALVVPVQFVQRVGRQRFVYLVPQGASKLKPTSIKTEVVTGVENNGLIQIISGVGSGAKLMKPPFNGPPRQGFMGMG